LIQTRVQNFPTRVLRRETRVRNFFRRVLRGETRVKNLLTRVLRNETRVKNFLTRVLISHSRVAHCHSARPTVFAIGSSRILSGLCAAAFLGVILSLLGENRAGARRRLLLGKWGENKKRCGFKVILRPFRKVVCAAKSPAWSCDGVR
jgi:hypothetical protein